MPRKDPSCFPNYAPTLPNVIADCVRQHGEREFLVGPSQRLTFREAEAVSAELALGLLAVGVGKGTRTAILMPNGPDWVTAWWAAARVGALTVALSTFFQPRELAWALREADIDTLLVIDRFMNNDYLARLEVALPELSHHDTPQLVLRSHPYLRRIVCWGQDRRPWAIAGPGELLASAHADCRFDRALLQAVETAVTPSDDLVGICTSGSTSAPKIVIHTHANVIRLTHTYRRYVRLNPSDRNYSGMPFFWVGGLNVNLLQAMYGGAAMVFAASTRPEDVLEAIRRERVTRVSMWPAQVAALAEQARANGSDTSSVKRGLDTPVDETGQSIPANRRIASTMGMTESFGPHGAGRFDETLPEEKGGSWGYEIEGIERKIVDPVTGVELPAGEIGELYIRGFSMMRGYYKRERSEVFQPDGFFATGDLCRIDADGYIWFIGRDSEMIKTAGANVAPREVELLMETYPEVREAIVMGLPDAVKGEVIVAVAVPREGHFIDSHELLARLRGDLSAYKVPKQIVAMSQDDIPRTANGKPLKPRLKELLPALLS